MWVLCGCLLRSVPVGYAEIPDMLFLIRSIDKNCLVLSVYTAPPPAPQKIPFGRAMDV